MALLLCLWQVGNSVTIAPNFMLYFGWQTNVVAYFQVNNFIKIMTSRDRAMSDEGEEACGGWQLKFAASFDKLAASLLLLPPLALRLCT